MIAVVRICAGNGSRFGLFGMAILPGPFGREPIRDGLPDEILRLNHTEFPIADGSARGPYQSIDTCHHPRGGETGSNEAFPPGGFNQVRQLGHLPLAGFDDLRLVVELGGRVQETKRLASADNGPGDQPQGIGRGARIRRGEPGCPVRLVDGSTGQRLEQPRTALEVAKNRRSPDPRVDRDLVE